MLIIAIFKNRTGPRTLHIIDSEHVDVGFLGCNAVWTQLPGLRIRDGAFILTVLARLKQDKKIISLLSYFHD
jgi:hypothetical protein